MNGTSPLYVEIERLKAQNKELYNALKAIMSTYVVKPDDEINQAIYKLGKSTLEEASNKYDR